MIRLMVLFVAVLLGCAACGESDVPGSARSVIMITLDTTRADRIGAYGCEDAVTPTIDRLAREGVLFEFAQSPAPITLPAHASILSGVYPSAHGVHDNALFRMKDSSTLLAEVLAGHGLRCGAFVGSYVLDDRFGLDQGFEVYSSPHTSKRSESPASEVVDAATRWFDTLDSSEAFFAWVHLYDPHEPNIAPAGYASRFAKPYDAEVSYCDDQIDRLLKHLEARGLADDLLIIVTSDHGEGFGDHGEPRHGIFIYQSTMRVPLVVSGSPVAASAGTRVGFPVSIVSLPATVLELLGIPVSEMPMMSVKPLLEGDGKLAAEDSTRPLYLESYLPYHTKRWHPYVGVVSGGYKLIRGRHVELYDLRADPSESLDLSSGEPEVVAELQGQLDGFLEQDQALSWAAEEVVSVQELKALQALGYTGGNKGDNPFDPDLPDPRERLPDLVTIAKAKILIAAAYRMMPATIPGQPGPGPVGEPRELLLRALDILRGLEETYAADPQLAIVIGAVKVAMRDYEGALPYCERATREHPISPSVHYTLGINYAGLGRPDDALKSMRTALGLDPTYMQPYAFLVARHRDREEFGHAAWWLQKRMKYLEKGGAPRSRAVIELRSTKRQMRAHGQTLTPPANPL